ncbi:hypothetical protein CAQUA_08730 [Corynebacterium aquatimens]|uniref:Uncharacterized protein n=1 Tax=Corynebacterium aquatimens TaxID=1190508 RepID=A0A931GTP9_9CORY|nr:hypothetical protein [Corynebacterium aquatimens]WJY66434.1 hypothetical protein CAQUA_08730 [Corynebacterium aquatimens]
MSLKTAILGVPGQLSFGSREPGAAGRGEVGPERSGVSKIGPERLGVSKVGPELENEPENGNFGRSRPTFLREP